jgi:hypothetical protein
VTAAVTGLINCSRPSIVAAQGCEDEVVGAGKINGKKEKIDEEIEKPH